MEGWSTEMLHTGAPDTRATKGPGDAGNSSDSLASAPGRSDALLHEVAAHVRRLLRPARSRSISTGRNDYWSQIGACLRPDANEKGRSMGWFFLSYKVISLHRQCRLKVGS